MNILTVSADRPTSDVTSVVHPLDEQVVRTLVAQGPAGTDDIADSIDCETVVVERRLSSLADIGAIDQTSVDGVTVWYTNCYALKRTTPDGTSVVNLANEGLTTYNWRDWASEAGNAYIGPETPFGNPYQRENHSRKLTVALYRLWLHRRAATDESFHQSLESLHGKSLGCWRGPELCFGHVILAFMDPRTPSAEMPFDDTITDLESVEDPQRGRRQDRRPSNQSCEERQWRCSHCGLHGTSTHDELQRVCPLCYVGDCVPLNSE